MNWLGIALIVIFAGVMCLGITMGIIVCMSHMNDSWQWGVADGQGLATDKNE